MLEVLASNAELRAGVSREQAIQLLLLYLGMDVYRVLVIDFGWPHPDWVAWTAATIAEQVFATK
jgi:hypothetical protein